MEYVLKAAIMRSGERELFGENNITEDYLRAFLGGARIWISETEQISVKVQTKIYASGIMTLSLLASENSQLNVDDFIDRRVNLSELPIVSIEVDPPAAYLGLYSALVQGASNVIARWKSLRLRRFLPAIYPTKVGPNGVRFVRFDKLNGLSKGLSLNGLMLDFVRTIAYCLGRPRSGIPYLLLREPQEPRWTGYWKSSPHVHLRAFSGQKFSAGENELLHQKAFKKILARSTRDVPIRAGLPPSLRLYDDFGFYVNEALILFVYTPLRERPIIDGTEAHPVMLPTITHEVKAEMIELGSILYFSVLHELDDRKVSWDRTLSIWEHCLDFEKTLLTAGQYGEVKDAILAGLEARRFSELKQITVSTLALDRKSVV